METLDDNESRRKGNSPSENIIKTIGVIIIICLVALAICSFTLEYLGFLVGLIVAIIGFPVLSFVCGLGWLVYGKKKEGAVLTLIGLVGGVIGFSICGGF